MSNVTTLDPATRTDARATTATDYALLALRLVLGIVFMAHGAQKVFGAFGGPGWANVIKGMGPVLGVLVPIGEFFGGLGILLGFLTRFSAASIAVIMLGAILKVHLANGFFMNWGGKQAGEGFEYHLLVIGMCAALLLTGPGLLNIGRSLPLPKRPDTGNLVPALE
ncbi:MAG: DoxX family protein [Armatimonadetes bacterium]|nr:DoxX family protein [Armatimonadota bacterium]